MYTADLSEALKRRDMSSMPLIDFIRVEFPNLICDFRIIQTLINNGLPEEDVLRLIFLSLEVQKHIEDNRIHKANAETPDPWLIYKKIFNGAADKRDFLAAFRATSGTEITNDYILVSKKAIAIIEQLNLFDLSVDDKKEIVDSLSRRQNGFADIVINMLKAVSEDESLIYKTMNTIDKNLRKDPMVVSDVLAYLDYNEQSTEAPLESCFIYDRFIPYCLDKDTKSICFINPSPFFVKRILTNYTISKKHVVFYLKEERMAGALMKCYSRPNMFFECIDSLMSNLSILSIFDHLFIFGTEMDNADVILDTLHFAESNSFKELLIHLFDSDSRLLKKTEIHDAISAMKIDRIILLPSDITNTKEPKRKSIVEFQTHVESDENNEIELMQFKLNKDDKHQIISSKARKATITQDQYRTLESPIRRLYLDSLQNGDRERRSSFSISYSPELTIDYTFSGADRIRARMRKPDSTTKKGNAIANTIAEAVLKEDERPEEWLLSDYPFRNHKSAGIKNKIQDAVSYYFKEHITIATLSLKTFMYIHPEIEEGLQEKHRIVYRELMADDASRVQIKSFNSDMVIELTDRLVQNRSIKSSYSQIIDIIEGIFNLAIRYGFSNENPARKVKNNLNPNKYTAYDIKQNLGINHFDLESREVLMKKCRELRRTKPELSLAIMLMFLTGMQPEEICALRWSDYQSKNQCSCLTVRRLISTDGTRFIPLKNSSQYRVIPLADYLNNLLKQEKERQIIHYQCSEKELDERSIIKGTSATINGTFVSYSPALLYKNSRSIINEYKDEEDIIWIPRDDGTSISLDLQDTPGKIFRSNYRHYAVNFSDMDGDVVDYLLGVKGKDVFSFNYCDYSNSECLDIIYNQQKKLEEILLNGKDI